MKFSEVFFSLVALAAVGCFTALLVLQVLENKFYKNPEDTNFGSNIWPKVFRIIPIEPLESTTDSNPNTP